MIRFKELIMWKFGYDSKAFFPISADDIIDN